MRRRTDGLAPTEHGEVGFDFGAAMESMMLGSAPEPRAAAAPKSPLAAGFRERP